MIIFLDNSNLLDVKTGLIVHGCNAQGVMGSGVAKQLRDKYPDIYTEYVTHLEYLKLEQYPLLGVVSFVAIPGMPDLIVANAITQEFYGRDPGTQYVSYEAIFVAMATCLAFARNKDIDIHIPFMIGAGLGGGDLATIKSIIEDLSQAHQKNIYCHIYNKRG